MLLTIRKAAQCMEDGDEDAVLTIQGCSNSATCTLRERGRARGSGRRRQGVCRLLPSCVSGSHLRPRPGRGAARRRRTWGRSVLGRLWGTAASGSHSFTHTSSGAAACSRGLSPARGHEDREPSSETGEASACSSHGRRPRGASPSRHPTTDSFGQKPGLACEEAGILTFRTRWEELRQSEGHILGWI